MEHIYLNCPFRDKELAKQRGARWDPAVKKWYVTKDMPLADFQAWLPEDIVLEAKPNAPFSEITAPPDDFPQLTIKQFIQQIQQAFYQKFSGSIWLVGQITRIKALGKGYSVELIDQQDNGAIANACCLSVNAWGDQWHKIQEKMLNAFGQELAEGMLVRLFIQPEFHPRYHLGGKILDIDPAVTLGEFALMQQKLKAQLQAAGILHANRELPSPIDYCRVAVIHPQGASGYHDFKSEADILAQLNLCQFYYFASRFEGDAAELDLLQAFQQVRDLHTENPLDALVIIRGGGSRQGLLNLIKYPLLEQICTFPIPVMTGLGHADDQLLIEEVSHLRRDTPSKAIHFILNTIVTRAEQGAQSWNIILTKGQQQLNECTRLTENHMQSIKENSKSIFFSSLHQLQQYHHFIAQQTARNIQKLQENLQQHRKKLYQCTLHFRQKQEDIRRIKQDIALKSQLKIQCIKNNMTHWLHDLSQNSRNTLQFTQREIQHLSEIIATYDYKKILARGYSLARSQQGQVLRTKEQAQYENKFQIEFSDGKLSVNLNKGD